MSSIKHGSPVNVAQGSTSRNAGSAHGRSRQKADQYLVAADAPSTVRAYTADWKHFSLWCAARDLPPMPASPQLVGDYLSDLGEGYARATLRRKVAAIARANRRAGHRLVSVPPASSADRAVENSPVWRGGSPVSPALWGAARP